MSGAPQRPRGRPEGSFGTVATALLSAAAREPGTVVQLAERACVGYGAARYTASRLVSAGALAPRSAGRPVVLGAATVAAPGAGASAPAMHAALDTLRSFWEIRPPGGWAAE